MIDTSIKQITKEHWDIAVRLAVESGTYHFVVYVDDPNFPGDRTSAVSKVVRSVGGSHEFVNLSAYEWREASEEEKASDLALIYTQMGDCTDFQMMPVDKGYVMVRPENTYTYFAYNREIHKSVQDYAIHMEKGPDWSAVHALWEAEEMKRGLALTPSPKGKSKSL